MSAAFPATGPLGSDDSILAVLARIEPAGWKALWRAAAEVAAEAVHGTWRIGEAVITIPGNDAPPEVVSDRFITYSPAVQGLVRLLVELGIAGPLSWAAWDGMARYDDAQGLTTAPVTDAVRWITIAVCAERLVDGRIESVLHDGTLQAALARIRAWTQDPAG